MGNGHLEERLRNVIRDCIRCDACQKECAFLRKHGKPRDIAERYDPGKKQDQEMPFECSLCGLCTAVCPKGVDPSGLFLEMRRETVRRGAGDYSDHAALLQYERKGTSKLFSWYALPRGCDTIFFPGCTLSGTRSQKVIETFLHLRTAMPSVGIVLDCCTKPSHDLGRQEHFSAMFEEMRDYLTGHGVKNVIVACPNCYKVFARYGTGLTTRSIYEVIAPYTSGSVSGRGSTVTVHDPCAVRSHEGMQSSVRKIIKDKGFTIAEMAHSRQKTLCCGEGGTVGAIAPELARQWSKLRQAEAAGKTVVTYCAGCAGMLGRLAPTVHILELTKADGSSYEARSEATRPPFTYLKRLSLKRWIKKNVEAEHSRERTFTGKNAPRKNALIKFLIYLVFLAAVVITVRATGASRYLEQEALRTMIAGYGALAPVIYMLIYAIAPSLFLPGLPITIVGGILFGPFWGVVYAITGATIGACVAFLVSRYLAREWVAERLKSPRWRRLDEAVERHGWRVVAFTRLIPLFPFNLLNYAFGLTKIHFVHYAVTSFFAMLPACIAFIVFSSSLLDLIRGKVSLTFIVGVVLVVIVSMFPLLYRRYKAKKGEDDPV
ncbi:MAG: VTT domain-containing protein [Syntrophorhabdaceae bacterium]|nr:VTT domain-containing protein [Syntrophorhabdaceae bacterium]